MASVSRAPGAARRGGWRAAAPRVARRQRVLAARPAEARRCRRRAGPAAAAWQRAAVEGCGARVTALTPARTCCSAAPHRTARARMRARRAWAPRAAWTGPAGTHAWRAWSRVPIPAAPVHGVWTLRQAACSAAPTPTAWAPTRARHARWTSCARRQGAPVRRAASRVRAAASPRRPAARRMNAPTQAKCARPPPTVERCAPARVRRVLGCAEPRASRRRPAARTRTARGTARIAAR